MATEGQRHKRVAAPDWYVEARDGKVSMWMECYAGDVIGLKMVSPTTVEVAAAQLRQQWLRDGRMLEPPRFKLELASGALGESVEDLGGQETWIEHEVDAETGRNTLDDPDDPRQTAINWALWHKHERDLAAFQEAVAEQQFRVLVGTGTICDFPEDDSWLDDLRYAGIEVGDDRRDRTFARVWHVLTDVADKQELRIQMEMIGLGRMYTPELRSRFQTAIRSAMDGPIQQRFDAVVSDGIRELVAEFERRFDEATGSDAEEE